MYEKLRKLDTWIEARIKQLSKKITVRIMAFRMTAALHIFLWLHRRPWSGVSEMVRREVARQTRANVEGWLRYKGVLYCTTCLSTDQLKKITSGEYRCPPHALIAGPQEIKHNV